MGRLSRKQPQQGQGEKDRLRVINVLKGVDVVVTEDWQDSNGDIVTYTAELDDDVENLRMIHLRIDGQVLLSVEITDEQFHSFNSAFYQWLIARPHDSEI